MNFFIDAGSVLVLYLVFSASATDVQACSSELYTAGMVIFWYQVFFAIRDLTTMFCLLPCDNSHALSYPLRAFNAGAIDGFALGGLTIWLTTFIANPQPRECAADFTYAENWWVVCVIFLVIYWIYVVYCWIVGGCICVISCIVIAAAAGSRNGSLNDIFGGRLDRVPGAKAAI